MYEENNDMEQANEKVSYRMLSTEFQDFEDYAVKIEIRFRKPSGASCNRTVKDMNKNPAKAFHNLLFANVHPDDKNALQEAVEKYPGITITFASELLERSGFTADVVNKLGK